MYLRKKCLVLSAWPNSLLVVVVVVVVPSSSWHVQDRRSCKKDAAVRELETFSLLISDTIRIGTGSTDDKILTRFDHSLSKIQWEISEEGAEEEGEEDEEEDKPKRTSRLATEISLGVRTRSRAKGGEAGMNQGELDRRASELLAKKSKEKARTWDISKKN